MNRISNEMKISAYEEAIIEILDSAKRLSTNKAQAENIFHSAGIVVNDSLSLVSITGNAETCVNALMRKLSSQPTLKMAVKRILWNRGLRVGQSVYILCSSQTHRRTSWLARRTG